MGDMSDAAKLRVVIDGMALELADVEESDLTKELARRGLDYVNRLRAERPQLSEAELEKVLEAMLTGVLERLQQITESGGQFGSA
jgi:hypothetical protein